MLEANFLIRNESRSRSALIYQKRAKAMRTILGEPGGPARQFAPAARSALRIGCAGMVCAIVLAGCVQGPNVTLPSLAKDARPVLSAEQQKTAMQELATKKEAEHAAALKKIETK
jgi:hypothetical protein